MPSIKTATGAIAFSHNRVNPRPGLSPVVLVHGAGGQRADWPRQWHVMGAALGRRPVYALDLPGHGLSKGAGLDSVPDYASAVAGFLDAMDLSGAVIIGHSMGAAIALQLAVDRNPRLAAIVPIAGAARFRVATALLEGYRTDFEATVDMITGFSWPKTANETYMRQQRWHMLVAGQDVVHDDFLACRNFDVTDRLADIAIPVLAIASNTDKMVSYRAMTEMVAELKDARLETITGCGHFPQVEKRGQCAAPIDRFCGEIERAIKHSDPAAS